MKKKFVREIQENKYLILFIFIGIAIFVLGAFNKYEFHMDEIASFSLSNNTGFGWVVYDTSNSFFSHGTLDDGFQVMNNIFSFENVFRFQAGDVHPPLFYLVIHFISSLFPNKFTAWFGFIPNLLYFIISSYLIYKIILNIFENKNLALITLLVFCISPVVINDALFVRMYAMTGMFILLCLYNAIIIIFEEPKIRNYFGLFFSILFGTLTHYYFYIALFLICLFASIYLLCKKKYKVFGLSVFLVLLGVLISWAIFPEFFKHVTTTHHATNIIENIKMIENFDRIINQYLHLPVNVLYSLIVIPVTLFMLIYLSKINSKILSKYSVLLFVGYGYFIIVSLTSTYIDHRYMIPINSLVIITLTVAIFYFINIFINNKMKIPIVFLICLLFLNLSTLHLLFNSQNNTIMFAKKNSNLDCIVLSPNQVDSNTTNRLIFELREYNSVVFSKLGNDIFPELLQKNIVLYIYEDILFEDVFDWFSAYSSDFVINPVGKDSIAGYKIYEFIPYN